MRGILIDQKGIKSLLNLNQITFYKVGDKVNIYENSLREETFITFKEGDGNTWKIGCMEVLTKELLSN